MKNVCTGRILLENVAVATTCGVTHTHGEGGFGLADYKSDALPAELRRPVSALLCDTWLEMLVFDGVAHSLTHLTTPAALFAPT